MSFSQAEIRILDQLTIPYKCLPPRKAARLKKAFQRSSFAYPPPISGAALAPTALNANKGRAGFDAYTDAVCHAGAARRLVMQQERGADYEDLAGEFRGVYTHLRLIMQQSSSAKLLVMWPTSLPLWRVSCSAWGMQSRRAWLVQGGAARPKRLRVFSEQV